MSRPEQQIGARTRPPARAPPVVDSSSRRPCEIVRWAPWMIPGRAWRSPPDCGRCRASRAWPRHRGTSVTHARNGGLRVGACGRAASAPGRTGLSAVTSQNRSRRNLSRCAIAASIRSTASMSRGRAPRDIAPRRLRSSAWAAVQRFASSSIRAGASVASLAILGAGQGGAAIGLCVPAVASTDSSSRSLWRDAVANEDARARGSVSRPELAEGPARASHHSDGRSRRPVATARPRHHRACAPIREPIGPRDVLRPAPGPSAFRRDRRLRRGAEQASRGRGSRQHRRSAATRVHRGRGEESGVGDAFEARGPETSSATPALHEARADRRAGRSRSRRTRAISRGGRSG